MKASWERPPPIENMSLPLLPMSSATEKKIPLLLRPAIRAYVLGYAYSTAPRILTLLLTHPARRRNRRNEEESSSRPDSPLSSLLSVLKGGLELQRFPTFCAAIVGGSTLFEARDNGTFLTVLRGLHSDGRRRFSRGDSWLNSRPNCPLCKSQGGLGCCLLSLRSNVLSDAAPRESDALARVEAS